MHSNYVAELSGLITDLLEIEIKEDVMAHFDKVQNNLRYENFVYEIFCVCQNILSKIPTLEGRTVFLGKAREIIKEYY